MSFPFVSDFILPFIHLDLLYYFVLLLLLKMMMMKVVTAISLNSIIISILILLLPQASSSTFLGSNRLRWGVLNNYVPSLQKRLKQNVFSCSQEEEEEVDHNLQSELQVVYAVKNVIKSFYIGNMNVCNASCTLCRLRGGSTSFPDDEEEEKDEITGTSTVDSIKVSKKRCKKNNHHHRKKRRKPNKNDNDQQQKHHQKKKQSKNAKTGECLRRIKHEWKTMVQLGIGYDWATQQSIISTKKSKKSNCNKHPKDDQFYKYNYIRIGPMQNNLLHWHFSVQGPTNSVYQNGIYHGRIILPKTYPGHPPRIQILTPSGRFVTGEDICLSVSAFHPETWSPRWTILSLVDALRIHMLTTANEIGGLNSSDEMREKFAWSSRSWRLGCFDHGKMVKDGLFCPRQEEEDIGKLNEESIKADTKMEIDNVKCLIDNQAEQHEENEQHYSLADEKKDIEDTVAFIASMKENGIIGSNSDRKKSNTKHEVTRRPTSSRQQTRLETRRPPKESIIIITIRGILDFFQRHLEMGILFLCVYFFLR